VIDTGGGPITGPPHFSRGEYPMIDTTFPLHPLSDELREKLEKLVAKCVLNVVYDAQFAYESGRMPGFKIDARDLETGVLEAVRIPARDVLDGLAERFGISAFRFDVKLDYKDASYKWRLQFGMVEDIADPDQMSITGREGAGNG
jgi:hypothetical protein